MKNKPQASHIEQLSFKNNDVEEAGKRQFLRGLTALMGGAVVSQFTSDSVLAAAFDYQAQANSALTAGKLFSLPQMKILHDICAAVLPKTDTPSAAELDVHGFLDHQLLVCYGKKQQEQAKNLIDKINQQSTNLYSQEFIEISTEQQTKLLVALEGEKPGFNEQDQQHFAEFKSLLIFGYFTTEVGATQALNYQAVPGGFKGSVSYSSLKKSWGSLGFY